MSDEKHEIGEKIGGVQLKPGSTSRPAIAYQNDEDTGIYQRVPGENNFVSDGVEVARTNADGILIPTFVAGRTVTVGAGGQLEDTVTSGGHTIRESGTDQTTRTGLNFIDALAGAGLITDDAGGNETEVNLDLYVLRGVGRAGGTTIYGGSAASENLTLAGTSHATAGLVILSASNLRLAASPNNI